MPLIKDNPKFQTLLLSLKPGFGIRSFLKLWDYFHITNITQFLEHPETRKLMAAIPKSIVTQATEIHNNCEYLCVWENDYSALLKQITDPPIVLFYRGDYKVLNNPGIAVVGTRDMSAYGKDVATKFATEFNNIGMNVISGMAFGVDQQVLSNIKGSAAKPIAVLASDVDSPTPRMNTWLYKQILEEGGLIVSGTPPGVELQKGMFASRNRITAGLAQSTLVIEAGEKSGAIITAKLAFDYNRSVLAIPGNIDSPMSIGCNYLIQSNVAKLVKSVQDVYIEMGYDVQAKPGQIQPLELDSVASQLVAALRQGPLTVEELKQNLPTLADDAILSRLIDMELVNIVSLRIDGKYRLVL